HVLVSEVCRVVQRAETEGQRRPWLVVEQQAEETVPSDVVETVADVEVAREPAFEVELPTALGIALRMESDDGELAAQAQREARGAGVGDVGAGHREDRQGRLRPKRVRNVERVETCLREEL